MPRFSHFDLTLLNPSFDSPLVDVITELEYVRRLRLEGSTPGEVFFQLKSIFHMLESLSSARIEGNHTTLADYVENHLQAEPKTNDSLHELTNLEHAMSYIEEYIAADNNISELFIRELHALAVNGLIREGDPTPGTYRTGQVIIAQATHLPPDAFRISGYMAELVSFINENDAPKYDLIKVALAHHRFTWIHPFSNGNGRTVRLLTYALLLKFGFNLQQGGRVLNPTAIFCNDRELYYTMLSDADTGGQASLEAWCEYVLRGLLVELEKVDKLAQADYLFENILKPALQYSLERQLVTALEHRILLITAKLGRVKASDIKPVTKSLTDRQRSYQISKLVEQRMLLPISEGARQYTVGFVTNHLIRGVIHAMREEGFIPKTL